MGLELTRTEEKEVPLIPDGTYDATLLGIERAEQVKERDTLRWKFSVDAEDGEVELTGLTSYELNKNTKAGSWFKALGVDLGKIPIGGKFQLDDLRGKECSVVVKAKPMKNKGQISNVVDVLPKRKTKAKVDEEKVE